MISEYWQCEGERCDNGETIRGSLIKYKDQRFIVIEDLIAFEPNPYINIDSLSWCCFPTDMCMVKPETVRRVAVKPVSSFNDIYSERIVHQCPNCGNKINKRHAFCPSCGMAILWQNP